MKGAWDFHACSSCASARKSNLSDGDASVHGGDLLARVPFLAHGGICPTSPFSFLLFCAGFFLRPIPWVDSSSHLPLLFGSCLQCGNSFRLPSTAYGSTLSCCQELSSMCAKHLSVSLKEGVPPPFAASSHSFSGPSPTLEPHPPRSD